MHLQNRTRCKCRYLCSNFMRQMRKSIVLFLTFLIQIVAIQAQPAGAPLVRPKLVVGIVVDQMRWDYLYRYYNMYGRRWF